MKEINQRPDNEVIIGCNCGGTHFVEFCYSTWGDYKDFRILLIDRPYSFWGRIKNAVEHIIHGGDLFLIDVGIIQKDLDKIQELINGYKKLDLKEDEEQI